MRSFEDALQWWPSFSTHTSIPQLRAFIASHINDEYPTEHLRSVYWKTFLLFETTDTIKWPTKLRASRNYYTSRRTFYLRALDNADELDSSIDPLRDDPDSPWEALRKDEALRQEIFQDVDRCMPENLYFRQPKTQIMLWDLLFTWAKLHPDVGYRQGMHELAAPILWAVERDAIDPQLIPKGSQKKEQNSVGSLVQLVCDKDYIEHDTFTLFEIIMRDAKSSYEHDIGSQSRKGKESPMVARCRRIVEVHLMQTDSELATHLASVSIIPQIFLLRWIRLLFGREFSFDHTLRLWDRFFAEDHSAACIDLICVAMMLRIRWQLLGADYNTALTLLLKYPEQSSGSEVASFLDDALYIKTHMDLDGGHHIIFKRTGRRPSPVSRPATPEISTSGRSPVTSRFASPTHQLNRLTQHPAGLEGMLEDAARGLYLRGERLGLNQAVRGVVTEVRKNMQNIQSRTHSRLQGGNLSFGLSDGESSKAELLKKIEHLETRNKRLGEMLDDAVGALWSQNRKLATKQPVDQGETDTMTTAIAKVQFVQIYLSDPTLTLPPEPQSSGTADQSVTEHEADNNENGETMFDAESITNEEHTYDGELEDASAEELNTAVAQPFEQHAEPPVVPSKESRRPSTVNYMNVDAEPKSKPRPSLEQSSFSWMLGQEDRTTAARTAFMSASRFREGSTRGNSSAHGPAAFLFGEEEDDLFSKPKGKDKERKADADVHSRLFKLGDLKSKGDDG